MQEEVDFSLFWKIQQARGEKTEEKEGRQGTVAADVRFKQKKGTQTQNTCFINIKVQNPKVKMHKTQETDCRQTQEAGRHKSEKLENYKKKSKYKS